METINKHKWNGLSCGGHNYARPVSQQSQKLIPVLDVVALLHFQYQHRNVISTCSTRCCNIISVPWASPQGAPYHPSIHSVPKWIIKLRNCLELPQGNLFQWLNYVLKLNCVRLNLCRIIRVPCVLDRPAINLSLATSADSHCHPFATREHRHKINDRHNSTGGYLCTTRRELYTISHLYPWLPFNICIDLWYAGSISILIA